MADGLASLLWDQYCCLLLLPTAGDPRSIFFHT